MRARGTLPSPKMAAAATACAVQGGGVSLAAGGGRGPAPGLYEAAAAGRAVSGWPCLGDMALLREDAQSKVRAAAQAWLRRGVAVRPCPPAPG